MIFKPLEVSKTGLSNEVIEKIKNKIKNFSEIETVVIYGSRAKGNFRNGSDIDLCLLGENIPSDLVLRLDNSLDELMLPYSLDISIYNKIENPNFKSHIDRVGMVFYKKSS